MNEHAKEYWRQWLSPGVVMGLVGWALLAIGAWYRLTALENKFVDLSTQVERATSANQQAKEETIRYQEQLKNALARIDSLERFKDAQGDYNTSFMTSLAVLKKGA